jgi:hypothetical protein
MGKGMFINCLEWEQCVVMEIFRGRLSCYSRICVHCNMYWHKTVMFPVSHCTGNTGHTKLLQISTHTARKYVVRFCIVHTVHCR